MSIILKNVELRQIMVRTRMPFRYGIATLTEVPYLIVWGEFAINGHTVRGLAADVLPPKWFTKQPEAKLDDEILQMKHVILRACTHALDIGEQPNVFSWWTHVYESQMGDSELANYPPLLKGFGVSLVERAAIDAFCRAKNIPFFKALQTNQLGLDLGAIHTELSSCQPADLLPTTPSNRIRIRHTVGLSDPLVAGDVKDDDRIDDGLPQSLDECIRRYGLTHFKIKAPANLSDAVERLEAIAALLESQCDSYAFTLDGNEFFNNATEFQTYWEELRENKAIRHFLDKGLLLVEQPLHRDIALSKEVGETLSSWSNKPPLIIDESDGQLDSFAKALEIGYQGTSHKNCKGIFKGIANACLVSFRNQKSVGHNLLMTGEDLMNLGPIALMQDLSVVATMGLTHVERNGHHYVAGLSPFTNQIQRSILAQHKDLYHLHVAPNEISWPSLNIQDGMIELGSINQSPFGYAIDLQQDDFQICD